jgi:hypothetical protein
VVTTLITTYNIFKVTYDIIFQKKVYKGMDFNVLLLVLAYSARCLCVFVSTPTSNATETHRLYTDLFVNQGYNSKILPYTNRSEKFGKNLIIASYLFQAKYL